MSGPHLSAARRARDLDVLTGEQVDLLVVGGGVTGCGIALARPAAERALSVGSV